MTFYIHVPIFLFFFQALKKKTSDLEWTKGLTDLAIMSALDVNNGGGERMHPFLHFFSSAAYQ